MKKMILIITVWGIVCLLVYAPESNIMVIVNSPTFQKSDPLLQAHIYKESRNDPDAYNETEEAAGILQIRPIMIREVNRILTLQKSKIRFTLADRYDPKKSVQVWYIVQDYWNPDYNPRIASRMWNGGTPRYKKQSEEYYNQIKLLL